MENNEKLYDEPNEENTIPTGENVITEAETQHEPETLPSDIEGMSLSLLEALAYGNAVVCSDIPENTLVTENKALHFEKSNVEDLADKLQMMCNDTAFVNDLKDGVDDFILNKYNWNDIASATCDLYQKVMSK